MKIVYYSYTHFLDHVFPQVEALSKIAEVQVVIEIALENWKSSIFNLPQRNLKPGLHEASEIFDGNIPETVRDYWKKCSSFHFYVFNNRRSLHPNTWRQAWSLMNILRTSKADVIHFDGVSMRIAPFLWRLKQFPIVLNVHDSEPHSGEDGWRRRISTRLARNSADHFIFHSKFCKDEFISRSNAQPARTSMIPLGILDIFRNWMVSKEKEEKNNVLFFGRLSPYKGLEVFLKAAPIVAQKIGNCKFVIAGSPIQNYTIPSLPDLPKGSTFTIKNEYVTNLDLCNIMQQASLVVCPYMDASQSGVVLTAYAFDKPVIVTNVGGLPEYIWEGKTGYIVPPNDPERLAESIIQYLKKRSTLKKRKESLNKLRKNDLNWDKSAESTVKIYDKILCSRLR